MPRIIEWSCEMSNNHSAEAHGEIEVEDDATEEDIDKRVQQEVFDIFSWGWSEKA